LFVVEVDCDKGKDVASGQVCTRDAWLAKSDAWLAKNAHTERQESYGPENVTYTVVIVPAGTVTRREGLARWSYGFFRAPSSLGFLL
jgi:hypothetical protein